MTDKYVLVEHPSLINGKIRSLFGSTHQLKITAFQVSKKHIFFGVSSGGIYLFTRDTCTFVRLIPNTLGPPKLLSLCSDEKYLSVVTSSGAIVIYEDWLQGVDQNQHVFHHHQNCDITAIKWGQSTLFVGSATGLVTSITLRTSMFQAPVTCVMQLNASITQLEILGKYLLVSTLNRSLLCDTQTQRFKQIGKKPHSGAYGACFFSTGAIYCARPQARLWKVNLHGEVLVTLDFRPLIKDKSDSVIYWGNDTSAPLTITAGGDRVEPFTFMQLHLFLDKFILSFTSDEITVFDPIATTLQTQLTRFRDIKDIKIIQEFLYIWHGNFEFSVVSLMAVQELALESFLKQQYSFCAEFCIKYLDEVLHAINTSPKLHYLRALEGKLEGHNLELLKPFFVKLTELSKRLYFKNGHRMVTVHPAPLHANAVHDEPCDVESKRLNIQRNKQITQQIIKSTSIQELYPLLQSYQNNNNKLWCFEVFLSRLKPGEMFPEVEDYATEAFLVLNTGLDPGCTCGYPVPKTAKAPPRFYTAGCVIMETAPKQLLRQIPYMHRCALEHTEKVDAPLLVQFSKMKVVEQVAQKLTFDGWDEVVRLLLKLKKGCCLNCGTGIEVGDALGLSELGVLIARFIGPSNAVKLFKRHASGIKDGGLEQYFYQFCVMLATSAEGPGTLYRVFQSKKGPSQLNTSVTKYLQKKYLNNLDDKAAQAAVECSSCHVQFNHTLITTTTRTFKCGHSFHEICLKYNTSTCQVCSNV